jgi:hypothetical protein
MDVYGVYQGLKACTHRGRIFTHVFRIGFSTIKEAAMKKTSTWCLVVLLSLGSAERLVAQGTRSTEEVLSDQTGRTMV